MRRNSPGYSSIGVISSGQDKDRISYCEDCLKVNILSRLKHRIYLDEKGKIKENPPPDADRWRQCWKCGLIVAVHEAKSEVELDTLTEPRDNPFKFNNGLIKALGESRKFDRTGRQQHKRKFKQDLNQYKEEDIKTALKKGAKLVSYVELT
jgi:hypothetical protein